MRVTPILGPEDGAKSPGGQYYYDAGQGGYSPQLGVNFRTAANLNAVYAINGGTALAANARVNLDPATWIATANASGTFVAPAGGVPAGERFVALEYRA